MTGDREQKIRERAHAIWQDEGQPHGRHDDHWDQASREFDAEASKPGSAEPPKQKAVRKPRSTPAADAPKAPRATRTKKKAD